MTVLRRKMMEDLQLAGYSPKTQKGYLDAVRNLAKFYMRSPDLLTEEDIRHFFLHLINVRQAARSTVTIHLAGIKFFYVKTLGREWPVFDIVRPQPTKKLPAVLSREEVRAILSRIRKPMVKMALTVIYACGLRNAEGVKLKISDIDTSRKLLWVRCGKGWKDRAVPLADHVAKLLLAHYRNHGNREGWLFPLKNGGHIATDLVQRVFKQARHEAGIKKDATPHTLRHYAEFRIMPSWRGVTTINPLSRRYPMMFHSA